MTRNREIQIKHQRVSGFLEGHRLDAVILTRRCNFAWYTAGGLNHVPVAHDIGVASLLIDRERAVVVTSNLEAPRIDAEELGDTGITLCATAWHDLRALSELWSDLLGDRKVATDAPVAGLPSSVIGLPGDFARLRWGMTAGEIDRYRELGSDTASGLEAACREARPDMTEFELAALISANLMARGIRTSVCLVAGDDRARQYRHPIPTGSAFEKYGMGVAGGERHGLTVSCSRLFAFGPIDDDLRRRHEAVCRVDAEMIAATRPGRTIGEVFETAQRAYADRGFPDEWRHHHQGGLTGYLGREIKATPGDPVHVETGQVYAWNPTIAGTKSEDTILVGDDTNEILSATASWPARECEAGGLGWPRPDILTL